MSRVAAMVTIVAGLIAILVFLTGKQSLHDIIGTQTERNYGSKTAPAPQSSALVKGPPGRSYFIIKTCLESRGFVEGEHFRQKTGSDESTGVIQVNGAKVPSAQRPLINRCITGD